MKFKGWDKKPITDLTGQRFGLLTVAWFIGRRQFCCGAYETIWLCVCDCGKILHAGKNNLNKETRSCGCLNSEITQKSNSTHGQARRLTGLTPEYCSYSHAKARCENPDDRKYPDYGGRGIKFLFDSFESFFAELGPKPEPKNLYSVDRKNVNGNYEIGNVRWATAKQQVNNRRLKRIENFSDKELRQECIRRGWAI